MDKISIFYPIKVNVLNKIKVALSALSLLAPLSLHSQRMPLQSLTQRSCYEIRAANFSQTLTIAKISCRHYSGFRIFRYYNNKVALGIPKQL